MTMNLLSASAVLNTVLSVLLAILILLFMITVHELGHYVAGKILRFKINEFAIGFGPRIFRHTFKRSGEVFSVRLLPLGGFCAFEGEETDGLDARSFNNRPPWARILVFLAGPLTNYIVALLLIIISSFSFGQMVFRVDGVIPPAEGETYEYSLEKGDLILEADGKGIYLTTDLLGALDGRSAGENVRFTVCRDGREVETFVTLRGDCDFKNSSETNKLWRALGMDTEERDGGLYWTVGVESYRFSFFETLGRSFVYSFRIAGTIFKVLGELLTGHLGLSAMGGPVTTIKLTSEIASQSAQSFFEIAAYIGVNLAVFNLLPIPALDGSKIVFCLIEWIFRKPVPRKIEAVIHAVGFVLILAFAVLVDVLQFV